MLHLRRVRPLGAVLLGVVLVLVPVVSAAGSVPSRGPKGTGRVPVQQGVNVAAIPGAAPFGNTPSTTPEQVSFIMREQNLPQLQAAVEQGMSSFLTVSQFAAQYGQSPTAIAALQSYLAQYGITTTVYADDVDVSASGTAGQFDQALAVQQQQFSVPASHHGDQSVPAQVVHATSGPPELPAALAANVLAILGLTNYSPFTSHMVSADRSLAAAEATVGTGCADPTNTLPVACNLPQNFANRYNLAPLSQAGANGAGQTVGIVTLATVDPGAPQYFWQNIANIPATGRTVTLQNVDGGAGAPNADSSESDLDVEQAGGVAPGANVVVYQAPNSDSGFADAYFTAASQNVVSTLSASWGESETFVQSAVAAGTETASYEGAFDEVFLEMAAQGQSAFVSAGDAGAYDATGDVGTTNLSVDTSADSPFVTVAGGTTLPWSANLVDPSTGAGGSVNITAERAWGTDYMWPVLAGDYGSLAAAAKANIGGSGGGFSVLEPEPTYQQNVAGTETYQAVQYLNPITIKTVNGLSEPTDFSFNPAPAVTQGTGTGRAVPDLSTDADPETGYLVYAPAFALSGEPVIEAGWGGTSFVAPQLNGAAAVIDSSLGHRVGFWNPLIYAAAKTFPVPFTPLTQSGTSNDNLYFTGTPGTIYNQATGLGIPNFLTLARDLAPHPRKR